MTVGTMAEGATSAHALPPARGARIVEMRRRNDRREVPGGREGRDGRDGREGRKWETWESTSSGHASGHSSRSACDGGCQIRFSSFCANVTARSSWTRPITRRLRPPRDHQASDRLSRRSERIGASGASLAMMQRATGAPEGST
jgi:hypothetical protein